jgi:hypothetical protein
MAQSNSIAPNLPVAPSTYDQTYMNKLLSVLRLYFNQLDNSSPITAASQNIGAKNVVSALNISAPSTKGTPVIRVVSLPTQADLPNLRVGDVYYDTTANNVLKIKVS